MVTSGADHPTPRRDRFTSKGQAAARFIAQRWILKPVAWSVVRVTVVGRRKLRDVPEAFVVVANHSSHLDAPLILGALPRKLSRYLAAGAAADYFFDVWWRRGLTALFFNAFPVDRTGLNKRSVSARSLLERGVPLLVFPEGTRSKTGEMGHFKSGAASLAIATGVPTVPVALIGAGIAHPRGSSWPKAGRLPVGVVFGEPMRAEPDETAVAFTARVRAEIVRLHAAYAPRILSASGSPKPNAHPSPEGETA
ncbi:lysophospholipid acyltransferase family protein [Protaetiibacter mangrovi]|uniref:1-acyl-sn-glycerol-3-phosphate acyltransferase n=1 Tax=Protaetiibacter mangrovi TaxID=2970926 RepID=A0ABT1ZGG2_9MICO|nr:lysophospholipid acyltransferase family protein [Protaetiibacter mangrovi]MCS0499781.1 1-acyl-sn-glycerol-3-phosphate acyltransferase [Protaetiibacter mangrovi]TPW95656.1 1-acyl-sn-glycerol-3-phosphate acyltransferase [Schumannella luteola]